MTIENIIEAMVILPFSILFWGFAIYFVIHLFKKDED